MQITVRRDHYFRELHGSSSITGSPWEDLREEFGLNLDLRDLQNGLWLQVPNDDLAHEQARQARLHLREIARSLDNNDHIVVVSQRSFVGYLVGNIGEHFDEGEYRSYQFNDLFNEDDDMAFLARVGAQNESASGSSSNLSQITPVGSPDPIEVSSTDSSQVGGPNHPIEISSDSSANNIHFGLWCR
ncbi:hypothetical protein F5B21DRAFT_452557 [Xylaria acuta]|nr:hypothetical protein F5B21DRAFT_452557 [Xylaria acuta]